MCTYKTSEGENLFRQARGNARENDTQESRRDVCRLFWIAFDVQASLNAMSAIVTLARVLFTTSTFYIHCKELGKNPGIA